MLAGVIFVDICFLCTNSKKLLSTEASQSLAHVCISRYSVAGMRVHKPDSGNIICWPMTCNLLLNSK